MVTICSRLFSNSPFSHAPRQNHLCSYLLLLVVDCANDVFGSICDTVDDVTSSGEVDMSVPKGDVVVSLYDGTLSAVASVAFDMAGTDVVVVAKPSVVVTESPRSVVDDIVTDDDVTLLSTNEKAKVMFVLSANGRTRYLLNNRVNLFYRYTVAYTNLNHIML